MDLGLSGKHALVTGASKGIGRAIALAFASEGVHVTLNYAQDAERAERTAAECRALGARVALVRADVAEEPEVDALVARAEAELGSVDVLVNNAGIYTTLPLAKIDTATWRRLLAVNLDGAFFCARRVLPSMIERHWGRIVSVVGYSGRTGGSVVGSAAHGAASKAALAGLTKSLAREVGPAGITVNGISPGIAATDIMAPLLADQARLRAALERIPIGRVSQPEEIAHLAVFLASPLAASVTGQVIEISGGALIA